MRVERHVRVRGINRIRLEFKVHTGNIRHRNISIGINRIRLEFKGE